MAKKKQSQEEIDAEIAELEALTGQPEVEASPVPTVQAVSDTILLDDGTRVDVDPYQEKSWRVRAVDGSYYDHCYDTPDGEWVYRTTNS